MTRVKNNTEKKGIGKIIDNAIEEGKDEGIEKVLELAKDMVAKDLLSRGIDDEYVIEITGLDQSIIDNLKKNLSLPTQ